jgi:hypothetical protein
MLHIIRPTLALILFLRVATGQTASMPYSLSLSESQTNRVDLRLSNVGTSNIEGIYAVITCPTFEVTINHDPLVLDELSRFIVPGSFSLIPTGGLQSECSIKESAVILSNGSAVGDSTAETAIRDRRRGALEELAIARELISRAAKGGVDEQSLISFFSSRSAEIAKDPNTNRAGYTGHTAVIRKLQRVLALGQSWGGQNIRSFSERASASLKLIEDWQSKLSNVVNTAG